MERNLLEECQEIVKENPYAAKIGIELLEAREGYVSAKVDVKEEFQNIYGDLHGGFLYTIADNVAGIAACVYGYYVTTINGSIQYLRAGRNTKTVFCKAKAVKAGKTITVVQAELTDEKGLLLNTAEFTYFNLKKKIGRQEEKA